MLLQYNVTTSKKYNTNNMRKEEWRKIEDYPTYMISNLGNVKNVKTGKILTLRKVRGYYQCCLSNYGKLKYIFNHRLVAMAFIPNPDNLPYINHKDEDKTNNFVYINEDGTVNLEKSNLEWCTAKYNINYGTANQRRSNSHKGKIVSEEIRKKLSKALKGRKISEESIKKRVAKTTNGKLSKPVLQIDPITNEVIAEFPSTAEVQRQLGINKGRISSCCNNIANGYIWRYK